jgi:hypothetical protein
MERPRILYSGIKIFHSIVGIFHQKRGAPFSSDIKGFSPNRFVALSEYFSLLMVFLINRDALFRRDNVFPSNGKTSIVY